MFEKVNMYQPDKVADRIAGALVDLAYQAQDNPKIAVEVLIGHGNCHIIAETSVNLLYKEVFAAVKRIAGQIKVNYVEVPRNVNLARNQVGKARCGDCGIYRGAVVTDEQHALAGVAKYMQQKYRSDGKYVVSDAKLTVCQSRADNFDLIQDSLIFGFGIDNSGELFREVLTNPLGAWDGGIGVDCGATNRQLNSDAGDSIVGSGLHGKDLSKPDVSISIFAWLKAQEIGAPVEMCCAIGDEDVVCNGEVLSFSEVIAAAKKYIESIGGFEKFAELGLIR